jgi:hypothetical protein
VPRSLNENLELLRHTSVKIEIVFTKRYNNSILLLMKLSKAERILLDFISEEMDERNYIINSTLLRDKFNFLLKKIGQETYADNTIQKCFKKLTQVEFLRKVKGRGTYQVNPLFFFKGTEEQRQKVIREQLEEINRIAINKHRQELIIQKAYACPQKEE